MAAKIRAMELLPRAFDTEYLKLYAVVFAGWGLTAVGTSLFFGGFPIVGGAVSAFLGIVAGGFLWIPGAFVLFGGLVATARKVILETTNDEFVKIDRAVDAPTGSKTADDGSSSRSTDAPETPIRAGSRSSPTAGAQSSSRVEDPGASDEEAATEGSGDGDVEAEKTD